MTDQEIRLQFGEMNAGEMRLARALVAWHDREIAKLKAELAALRQPILADDGRSLGQVAMEASFDADEEGLTVDECYEAAAQADAAVVLAQAVRRMEAVPVEELCDAYEAAYTSYGGMGAVRARLIAAAKGEGQAVVVNEPPQDERQPDLSGESEKQAQPWTPAVGDTVRLKSGGPVMTVTQVHQSSTFCQWFDPSVGLSNQPFPAACLTPSQP